DIPQGLAVLLKSAAQDSRDEDNHVFQRRPPSRRMARASSRATIECESYPGASRLTRFEHVFLGRLESRQRRILCGAPGVVMGRERPRRLALGFWNADQHRSDAGLEEACGDSEDFIRSQRDVINLSWTPAGAAGAQDNFVVRQGRARNLCGIHFGIE